MKKTILMLGTFDTKGREFAFLRAELLRHGTDVVSMDVGVMPSEPGFAVDIPAEQVAERAGCVLTQLRQRRDRGAAVAAMGRGARAVAAELYAAGRIDGVIGMGGGGGTSIASAAMAALPLGVPKLCLSTLASGDTRPYIGGRDIVLFPSIVDISGLNGFSCTMMSNAAAAICGMVCGERPEAPGREGGAILLSMFGNSTAGGSECARLLEERGWDTLVFHAVGTGGQSLEELARAGYAAGVLDLTTTEWADELCGGICSAGQDRLDAPGQTGTPHLIVPGCLDMVNFGPPETVPARYRDCGRVFFQWSPEATLMRTDKDECARLGSIFAEKANRAPETTALLVPMGGWSELGREGCPFHDAQADEAFLRSLRRLLRPDIPVRVSPCNINDPEFAQTAVEMLLAIIERTKTSKE